MAGNENSGAEKKPIKGQKKMTLKKPSGLSNIQLKKPSDSSGKSKLIPPQKNQLKKSSEPNSIQSEKDGVPGLRLIKPTHNINNNTDETRVRKKESGIQDENNDINSNVSGLSLRKSSAIFTAEERDAPATVQGESPLVADDNTGGRKASLRLSVSGSFEDQPESKLKVPGSLHLKKQGDNESSSNFDINTGLRLRKPLARAQKETGSGSETTQAVDSQESTHEVEDQEDTTHTLTLKKAKPAGNQAKLSLSATSESVVPDPTPPGLEPPSHLGTSSKSLSKISSLDQPKAKNDLALSHSPITPSLKKVQFSRKRKGGLTKKQKRQLILFGAPGVLIFSVLIYMFLSMFFFNEQTTDDPKPRPSSRKKTKTTDSKKNSKPKPENESQDHELATSIDDFGGIKFPEHLLIELEEEYGVEAKERFLEEWQGLSDEERQNYLHEIGALDEE